LSVHSSASWYVLVIKQGEVFEFGQLVGSCRMMSAALHAGVTARAAPASASTSTLVTHRVTPMGRSQHRRCARDSLPPGNSIDPPLDRRPAPTLAAIAGGAIASLIGTPCALQRELVIAVFRPRGWRAPARRCTARAHSDARCRCNFPQWVCLCHDSITTELSWSERKTYVVDHPSASGKTHHPTCRAAVSVAGSCSPRACASIGR
jgi:hypothetical protein